MDEIISYKMCAVKVRNAKLRNYLKTFYIVDFVIFYDHRKKTKVYLTMYCVLLWYQKERFWLHRAKW
jgi:hypothetical protein